MENRARPPDTLKALAEASFARWRDRPACTSMGVTLSYGALDERSAAFGAFLRRQLGLEPGERVAIMLPNLLQYPLALIGALRAGLAVVNVNPLYTAAELQFQLADSGAAAVSPAAWRCSARWPSAGSASASGARLMPVKARASRCVTI